MLVYLAVARLLLSRVWLKFILELRLACLVELLLWSVSIDLPASSLVVSGPPVPVFPFRRAPSARRFRTRPCQFSRFVARHPPDVSAPARASFLVSSRAIRPTFPHPPVPFSRFVARHQPDVSAPPVPFSRFVARHPPDVSAPPVPFSRFVARHPPDVSAPPVPFSRFVARHPPDVSAPPVPFSRFVARHPPDVSAPPVPFSPFVARHPPDVSAPPVPFSRFVARHSPDALVCPSGFPLRRALFVRRLFPSVPSPVLSLSALPAHRSFFLSPGTIVLDEHLCSSAVC